MMRRIGRFVVHDDIVRACGPAIRAIHSEVTIFDCRYDVVEGRVYYAGWSSKFDQIGRGEAIPYYHVEMSGPTTNPSVSFIRHDQQPPAPPAYKGRGINAKGLADIPS